MEEGWRTFLADRILFGFFRFLVVEKFEKQLFGNYFLINKKRGVRRKKVSFFLSNDERSIVS